MRKKIFFLSQEKLGSFHFKMKVKCGTEFRENNKTTRTEGQYLRRKIKCKCYTFVSLILALCTIDKVDFVLFPKKHFWLHKIAQKKIYI